MNAPMLVDFQKDGTTTKGLFKPARNGYPYWLTRDTDGSIAYLKSQAFVPQNVFTSIDKETGRPEVDMSHKPATGKSALFCPGLWGGKDWPYEAYNPKTGLVYIPSNENHCNTLEGKVLMVSRAEGKRSPKAAMPTALEPQSAGENATLANSFPVVDDLGAFQRSGKLVPFKNNRRLAKRQLEGDARAITGYRRLLCLSLQVVSRWFAITLVQHVEQERLGILSAGYFVGGCPSKRSRISFLCMPNHIQILYPVVSRVNPENRRRH
jgi:hypothetical protein